MKKSLILFGAVIAPLALSACVEDGYGGGVAVGAPYAYSGYYDDFYGPVYDGYWGGDGYFYYRHGVGERRFVRGDAAHFRRDVGGGNGGGGNFHPMQGNFTRQSGMHTPHFSGGHAGGGGHH